MGWHREGSELDEGGRGRHTEWVTCARCYPL